MKNKILGVLYGMAIGDAMGMPPELWSRKRLLEKYGYITDFMDGDEENEISYQYKKGNFTDDTSQALVIVDTLLKNEFVVNSNSIAKALLEWAYKEKAFENNILGPTSRATLEAFSRGEDPKKYSDTALSNGAAMRIAPIGSIFLASQKKELCNYVLNISRVTHSSDITIAGACIIAMAVSSVIDFSDKDRMIEDILSIEEYAMSLGASTVSASLGTRIKYAIKLAKEYKEDKKSFLNELYSMMGAGVNTVDSVPCAVAIAYYAFDVHEAALLSANLGGDTDTIGAMACAICGAVKGVGGIPKEDIELIKTANNVDFSFYAEKLALIRGKLV